jgi:hypothetical protein
MTKERDSLDDQPENDIGLIAVPHIGVGQFLTYRVQYFLKPRRQLPMGPWW